MKIKLKIKLGLLRNEVEDEKEGRMLYAELHVIVKSREGRGVFIG